MAKTCGAAAELDGDTILSCGEKPGHAGPVHRDGDHEWGDQNLPPVAPDPQPAPPTP